MPQHRLNVYTCNRCGTKMTTIDLHEGTTPFLLECRTCQKGMAESSMYLVPQSRDAVLAFHRPSSPQGLDELTCEYLRNGGLLPIPTRAPLGPPLPQQQPHSAACLVTAFAIILGVPVEELIAQIGHDGSEIIYPDLREPLCRRGHHIQELIFACFERGYAVTPFEPMPVGRYTEDKTRTWRADWFEKILQMRRGVLVGLYRNRSHSVAWTSRSTIDPDTGRSIVASEMEITCLWTLTPQAKQLYTE